jgi:phosphoribosylformylglycinamidine (FGAM) synthase PurS component
MELMKFLKFLGCKQLESDNCILVNLEIKVFISVYVDDLLVIGNSESVEGIINELKNKFETKDLGEVSFILGIKIERLKEEIKMSQGNYIQDTLEKFGMKDCKFVATPLEVGVKLSKEDEPKTEEEREEMKKIPYREVIGSLNYLSTCTRPDISSAVSLVGRYASNPGLKHWKAVKRILRYLKGTADYCLVLKPESTELVGYCDADWAEDQDMRRSQSGYCFTIGGSLISWKSKLQQTVSLSTMESEYKALAYAVQELYWFRTILTWSLVM